MSHDVTHCSVELAKLVERRPFFLFLTSLPASSNNDMHARILADDITPES